MKTKSFIAGLLILMASSSFLMAQPPQGEKGICHKVEKFVDNLSDDQKTKIEEIHSSKMSDIKEIKANLKIKKAELNKLEIADNADLNAINSKIDEIFTIKITMFKNHAVVKQEIRNILTPEQRDQFDLHSEKMKYHGNHKGHGNGTKGSHGPHGGKCKKTE